MILVRKETNPDDLRGMVAAQGILTSRGGKTSHAAVVARGMGRTCVCGAESLDVDAKPKEVRVRDGETLREGDVISIDGTTGEVFAGEVPVSDSLVVRHFEGEKIDDDLVSAVGRIMAHADGARRLRVRANSDTPDDASRARRFGAQGIGLCRTEHMFLGDRRELVERLIVAEDEASQAAALDALLPLQRQDFIEIFEAMDGLPVTIRLIDPPLHEFLPDLTELSVEVALAEERGDDGEQAEHDRVLLQHVRRLHEQNPMLGLRGVRLGIQIPGLFAMQARAILEAAADYAADGGRPLPEIMIPLVASVRELDVVKAEILAVAERDPGGPRRHGSTSSIGTMIELPRAAFLADRIAGSADFFSFGTNDLTQMAWGFSRDDVEAAFFSRYFDHGIFDVSPFESLDQLGVGGMVEMGTAEGPGDQAGPQGRASAASTAATRGRSTSSTRSGSTTCRARRSGCRWRGWRPAARCWPSARAALRAQKSAEARACRPRSTRGSSLPTAPNSASRCSRAASRSSPDVRRTSSTSRLNASSTWPPSRSRSATMVWAATSSGVGRRGLAGLLEVDAAGALQHLGHRQPGGRLGVGGVGVDELLVLGDGAVDVVGLEGGLGGGVARVDGGLAPRPRRSAAGCGGPRLVAPGDALGGELLDHLGQGRAQLLERDRVLEQRHRATVDDGHDQRDRRDLHRLGDLRGGVDVDQPDEEAALELPRQRLGVLRRAARSRATGCARRTPAAPAPSSRPRRWPGSSAR